MPARWPSLSLGSTVALLASVSLAGTAFAQAVGPGLERRTLPDTQPELAPPEFAPPAPRFELPPLPQLPERRLGGGPTIELNQVEFTGNTALTNEELLAVATPYLGRPVTLEELFQLRDELTLAYVNRGYVNSGAVLPDQEVAGGVVRFEIVEGELEDIELDGVTSYNPDYLKARIRLGADRPLNVQRLQERLQLLLLEPSIARLDVRLEPGSSPGQARLVVAVEENPQLDVYVRALNDVSPSIGGNHLQTIATWNNMLGRDDPLTLLLGATEGLREAGLDYSVPLNARGLRFHIGGELSHSKVITDDLKDLDIESDARSLTFGFSMPVIDTVSDRVGLDLSFTRQRDETFLLGEPFAFSPGTDNGRSDLSLLRFTQDWQNRGQQRAISVASTFTLGLDLFGATINPTEPDGQFLSWLGQGELSHRIFSDYDQLVVRATAQLASDPLLATEQFALGGLGSVRGYRVNQVVRDMGWTFSVEYRWPVLQYVTPDYAAQPDAQVVELVPFFDAGGGFDHPDNPVDESSEELASLGIGVRWRPLPRLLAELYWGVPLMNRENADDDELQDSGISFRIGFDLY